MVCVQAGEKLELEASLRTAKGQVLYLQVSHEAGQEFVESFSAGKVVLVLCQCGRAPGQQQVPDRCLPG
jgi:hypothetical protein